MNRVTAFVASEVESRTVDLLLAGCVGTGTAGGTIFVSGWGTVALIGILVGLVVFIVIYRASVKKSRLEKEQLEYGRRVRAENYRKIKRRGL